MPTDLQLTERSRETRGRLLRTARSIFEQTGYDAASISMIVEMAEVSRGTFYLYFESKADIFRTLALEIQERLVEIQIRSGATDPIEMLQGAIASFMKFYRENAHIMAVLEQVATHDDEFRALRRDMRRSVADRAIRYIRNGQSAGILPTTVDPRYAGTALTGMVDRFAYVWVVLEEEFDEAEAVTNLTRLWYQAVGGHLDAPIN